MSRRNDGTEGARKRRNGLSKFSGSWQGFVDIPLTTAQKERLAALGEADYPDVGGFLEAVLADGYKVSFVRDERHHCAIATLTGKAEGCENAGFSLSARGPDLARAVLVLAFKHFELCDAQRWDGHAETNGGQLSMWD